MIPAVTSFPQPLRCNLTILATSDLHLQLCPWDYYANRAAPGTGLAAVSGALARLRAESGNTLLVDNGDFLQGSALGDALLAERHGKARAHPMIAAMNLAGFDAVSLGNHDFDYGLGVLSAALSEAKFPALCANLTGAERVAVPYAGWTILHREMIDSAGNPCRLRIGLFGVTPPQVMMWNQPKLAGRLRARGMISAARDAIAGMQKTGVDLIVGLCHCGIGTPGAQDSDENAALAIAALPGVDALVAGHTHDVFPGPDFAGTRGVDIETSTLAGKPACMPGFGASHVGLLHLELSPRAGGGWQVQTGRGEARPLTPPRSAGPPPEMSFREACDASAGLSPEFAALCLQAHEATVSHLDRAVGRSESHLSSYFAMTGDCPVTGLVTDAMLWYLKSRLPQAERGTARLLAAASPWRAGGRRGPSHYTNLPPGPVLARDVAALCPFPDELRALRLTGRELADWLEHSARAFNTIPPGSRDMALLADDWASYNFDVIRGLTYEIDLSGPGPRIRNLCCEGLPVRESDSFLLATTSYRAAGGGGFPATGPEGRVLFDTALTIGRIVEEFLTRNGAYRAAATTPWSFTPVPEATAIFETGPCAIALLPRRGFESLGNEPDGFLRLRMNMGEIGPLHPAD
ncbi:5'-nucleotidase C-terminal domain-containing protein [Falsigemmobacter faecalis]|uniref:5'-nucleotidase C-terminal domain-containing protein n=1 Tax=Falsigemmobacter faecalis TaxID=2488730 RepID=UPI00131570EF|nr:5'-nucleotidase C-terminal domain-containing protein [Falsigemmobacter faecalis]